MLYTLTDLNLREVKALRKSLDSIPITGIDAAFIAMLQHKISTQITEIEGFIKQEEVNKQEQLQKAIKSTPKSTPPKSGKKP